MKNLIKKRIAFFTILAFSIFLLNSCQTENLAVENHEHSKITTKTLTGKEAETIAGRLKQLLPAKTINPKSNLQNQELASSYGTIDYSKIAVVEENGTTTYAFNIIDTNIADNKFSNLILKEENNYSTVKVAEYVMTQDFATNYYSGQEPITNFEGILNQKIISNNNPCSPDDSSAPVAGIGGGGGGGDDGTSGGSYYGGSTLGGGGGSFRLTCNDCGRSYSSIRGWQSGVCAKYDVTLVVSFSEPPTTAEPNPCDDNSTLPLIIFNENDLILQDFFRNDLNQEQRLFLSSSDPSVNDALNNYLIQNAGTGIIDSDAVVFAKDMINQMLQNPSVFTSIKPFLIEKNIDDTNLNPCQKNVLTAVKSTTVSDIAQVLAKLDANGSVYNTTMKTETLPNGNTSPATTKRESAYNYTIYISPDYAGKTKLFIASLMFHEMIHAYFMSIIDDYRANPNNNQNLYNLSSFPSLFQAYCDKKYPPASGTAQNIHHLEMANNYVDALSRALQEYQTGIPVPAGTNPDQIYTDLAWGGLNETPVFEATYPVGNPDRQRILNRLACEQNGTPIGQGTPNQQNPMGQPCN